MIDVYYLKEYGKIWAEYEKAKFKLFEYAAGSKKIIYPLLKRKIDEDFWDVISPYGYSGPYSNSDNLNFYQKFRENFDQYCQENKIVSEFIRFHPLLKNHRLASKVITVKRRGETVFIDLKNSKEYLWKDLRKGHQGSIKKAQKAEIDIKLEKGKTIGNFYKLYQQTMWRKKAEKFYLLSDDFFQNSFKQLKNQIFWLGAYLKNTLIGGAVFLKSDKYIHYYFAATDTNYLNLSPGSLILWEVIKLGKKLGLEKFHLGGGIDDKLSFYKQGFSPNQSEFYTGEVIHNQEVYDKLCQDKKIIKGDFFPLYRASINETKNQ